MSPKDKKPDHKQDSPEKLEDLPSEWAEEDQEIAGRKPDLGETEEDTSEL